LVKSLIGNNARVVRGIFFDKQAEANWKVPFHQDLSVAVREKIETDGFTAWTRKAEIHHVQPPVSILEKMVTLRIHLDETDESNGALKVVPNSHRFGRLSAKQTEDLKQQNGIVVCKVSRGAAMLMRPLLLHASSQTEENKRRRIIHLEFSAQNLPNGLQWYGS
jgi:ectoine hydroxylase-related dioxygenase (phytanoyl-CoA dioxygenase family)